MGTGGDLPSVLMTLTEELLTPYCGSASHFVTLVIYAAVTHYADFAMLAPYQLAECLLNVSIMNQNNGVGCIFCKLCQFS